MKRFGKTLTASLIAGSLLAGPAIAQTVIVEEAPQTLPAPVEAAPSGSVVITTEQVPEIRRVFVESAPEPVAVDFDVVTGAVVPDTVTVQPLPQPVVELVPQYEGYNYVALQDGRYAIVEPASSEVVYVLAN
ncbi:DUF1236 domain-containing protein [Pararhizobium haloflavum]|uniref:DUF1236 domain-containing protein n=1 Tax=Pararhizobium haloflavum TaxID=2037914 RepID=UPI000C18088B|nr:DUF1236 domain-containing protein [Pararhizobium haloflavum]